MRESQVDRPECLECGRYKSAILSPMMPMSGTVPCDILVIGEAPGRDEEKQGLQFIGQSGTLLRETLALYELDQYKIAFTNSVRCWAPDPLSGWRKKGNKKPTPTEIKCCNGLLLADIERAKPKVVLLMGSYALSAVLGRAGITRMRGKIIKADDRVYVPMYHPAYVLRDRRHEKTFRDDMMLVKGLMTELNGERSLIDKLRDRYEVITTIERYDEVITEALQKPVIAFDTEFYPLDAIEQPRTCYGVTLAWRRPGQRNYSCFIPIDHPESPFLGNTHVKDGVAQVARAVPFLMHNAEADVETLEKCFDVKPYEITVAGDTMNEALALHGPSISSALKTLSYNDTDIGGYDNELVEFVNGSNTHRSALSKPKISSADAIAAVAFHRKHGTLFDGEDYGTIPLKLLANPYGTGDGDAVLQLDDKYQPQIDATNQRWWFENIFNKAWRLNLEIRRNGLLLDWDEWTWRYQYYLKEKQRVYDSIREHSKVREFVVALEEQKKKFSLRSGPQMRALLFTVLGLTSSGKKTKTGKDQLDYAALVDIKERNIDHPDIPIVDLLLQISEIDKLLGTYLEGYIAMYNSKGNRVLYEDGRVHPWVHNFTESGRRGTSSPNTQNVPTGDLKSDYALHLKENLKANHPGISDDDLDVMAHPLLPDNMRMLFRAPDGHKFVSFDYGQLEFRLAACYANDKAMLDGCRSGDPHKVVQERFRFKDGKLDPLGPLLARVAAKRINFGIIYECSPKRLRQILKDAGVDLTLEQCEVIVSGMWKLYPGLAALVQKAHAQIREHGWIANQLGHRRWIPHGQGSPPTDPDAYETWERAQREGGNHLEQSLGHDLLELVMQAIQKLIDEHHLPWKIVLDAHDGFVIEVPDEDVVPVAILGKRCMETIPKGVLGDWLQVELPAEVAIGNHLGALTVWKPALQDAA